MAITDVTEATFAEFVQADKPVLIDFSATWCGPCKMLEPIIHELADDYEGRLVVGSVDVDQSPNTAAKFGIMSVPTLLVFKGGEVVKQLVGYMPKKQLESQLADIL